MSEKQGAMLCPVCRQPMARGKLYSPADGGIYWLPGETRPTLGGFRLTVKKVQDAGGVMLDQVRSLTFTAKARPDSYCCMECGVFLTRREAETKDAVDVG